MFIQTLKNCKKAGHNELSKINSYLGYFSHFREFKTIDKIFKSSPWVFELFTFTQNYKKAKLKAILFFNKIFWRKQILW